MASDFHTHSAHPGKKELLDGGKGKGPLWSLSFHPWYTGSMPEISFEEWQECAALGEIGVDKNKGTLPDMAMQLALFRELVRKGQEHGKPVVLHWVGSYEELFKTVKEFKGTSFLLHGFARRSIPLLEELLRQGMYVSLAPKLAGDEMFRTFLKSHPRVRVGLETDDREELEIEKLYELMDIPGFEKAADQHFEEFLQL